MSLININPKHNKIIDALRHNKQDDLHLLFVSETLAPEIPLDINGN